MVRRSALSAIFAISPLLIGCMVGVAGCSGIAVPETSVPSDVTEPSTSTTVVAPAGEVHPAFRQLAEAMAPLPVFGLVDLPSGMAVADSWWPVIDGGPNGDAGSVENPHVLGAMTEEPEGQLVLKWGDGWLDVVANFRGDLGDVSGERVGTVGGEPAYLYQVNGGWLVQWAYQGRWYGVFGRGVPRDVVTSTAATMSLVIDGR